MTEEDFCRHMLYTSTLTNKKKEKMLARVSKRFKGKVIKRILIRASNKKVHETFTIMEKAPTIFYLKAPTKTLC